MLTILQCTGNHKYLAPQATEVEEPCAVRPGLPTTLSGWPSLLTMLLSHCCPSGSPNPGTPALLKAFADSISFGAQLQPLPHVKMPLPPNLVTVYFCSRSHLCLKLFYLLLVHF